MRQSKLENNIVIVGNIPDSRKEIFAKAILEAKEDGVIIVNVPTNKEAKPFIDKGFEAIEVLNNLPEFEPEPMYLRYSRDMVECADRLIANSFYDDNVIPRKDRHGKFKEVQPSVLISRNSPCLCGSGKKYKKCCLGITSQRKRG